MTFRGVVSIHICIYTIKLNLPLTALIPLRVLLTPIKAVNFGQPSPLTVILAAPLFLTWKGRSELLVGAQGTSRPMSSAAGVDLSIHIPMAKKVFPIK